MYTLHAILLFVALTALDVTAEGRFPAGLNRFSINRNSGSTRVDLQKATSAQLYARSLIMRKPTRRTTAQRRQVSALSDDSPVTLTAVHEYPVTLSATDVNGDNLGSLVYRSDTNTWVSSTAEVEDATSVILPLGGLSSTTKSEIKTQSGSYLAMQHCSSISLDDYTEFNIESGSSSYLCLRNVEASPTSVPAANLDKDGWQLYETNIWGADTSAVTWTNSATFGATTTTLYMVQVAYTAPSGFNFPSDAIVGVADVSAFKARLDAEQTEAGYSISTHPITIQLISMQVTNKRV